MIYFTEDPHLGHANIVKMCGRPFEDIGEMNEALIAAWNDWVCVFGAVRWRKDI